MGRRCPHLHFRGGTLYFFWRDDDGKRREESLRTKDMEIAKERYENRMKEIRNGQSPNALKDWTLRDAAANWLDHRQRRVAKGTLNSEKSIVGNLVAWFGAAVRLRTIADISCIHRYQDHRLKKGISPKTINNELHVLAGVLQNLTSSSS